MLKPHPARMDQSGRIEREFVLKELEPAEVLPVRILQKPLDHCLVAHVVCVLEVVEANKKPDRQTGTTEVLDVQGAEFTVKERPVDGIRKTLQRMPAVQNLIQPGAEQIALV